MKTESKSIKGTKSPKENERGSYANKQQHKTKDQKKKKQAERSEDLDRTGTEG
jgi:hypothetical protein